MVDGKETTEVFGLVVFRDEFHRLMQRDVVDDEVVKVVGFEYDLTFVIVRVVEMVSVPVYETADSLVVRVYLDLTRVPTMDVDKVVEEDLEFLV